jgi:hypothetical protein
VTAGSGGPGGRSSDHEARTRFLSHIVTQLTSDPIDGWHSRLVDDEDEDERGPALLLALPGFTARCFAVSETQDRQLVASPFPGRGHPCVWVEVRRAGDDRLYDARKVPSNGAVVRFLRDLDRREVDAALVRATGADAEPGSGQAGSASVLPPSVEALRSPLVRGLNRWKRLDEVAVTIESLQAELPAGARASTQQAVSRVELDLVRTNFPRNLQGRIELDTQVLLTPLDAPPVAQGRQWWLLARGPRRRSDPEVISIRADTARRADARHRWDRTPWLWDGSVENPWRTVDRALTQLGGIGAATSTAQDPRIAEAQRSMIAQEAGRFDEAFEPYGLRVGSLVHRFLDCLPPPGLVGDAGFLIDHAFCHWDPEPWCRRAFETLWRLDPRRATDAVDAAYADARAAAEAKRRPQFRPPHLTLATMPDQTHVRKARLTLTANPDGGDKRVDIDISGSHEALPRSEWERPTAIDLARAGGAQPV